MEVSATEAKHSLKLLLDGIEEGGEPIALTRRSQPVAVLLSHDEYRRLLAVAVPEGVSA